MSENTPQSRSVPRLKDVADAASVSLSAASKILRGKRERFGDETCERVFEAARRLGWRRNLLVSGMQTGRTQTIGVIIPPFDSFWVGVLSGVNATMTSADYLPINVWVGDEATRPSEMTERQDAEGLALINRLLDRRVDGMILWPQFATTYYDHFRELIEHRRVPVAVIDHELSDEQIADSVETDDKQATANVAEYLAELGHRRIACVSIADTMGRAWSVRRREQFEAALKRNPDTEYQCWNVGFDPVEARNILAEMLSRWKPTAVFAVTDHEAAYVYRAAEAIGLEIPRQLSVVGFADLDFATILSPPLTTVRQHSKEIGRQAARLVIDRLEGVIHDAKAVTIRVGTELVVRESTAALNR